MEAEGTTAGRSGFAAFKRRVALWCLVALPGGCGWGPELNCGHIETLPSNRPGSGAECGLDAGVGAAGLTGPDSFVVAAASQSRVAFFPPDPGIPRPESEEDAGFTWSPGYLSFALYEDRHPCGGFVHIAPTSRTLRGNLFDSSQRFEPGTYPISDDAFRAERGASAVCIVNEAGREKRCALSGTVEILAVTACSLSGTLDLEMGSPGERPLRGIFTAIYCR